MIQLIRNMTLSVFSIADREEWTGEQAAQVQNKKMCPEAASARNQSYPEILFGILCLKFALPQKAMAGLLELLKLRPDSDVKSVDQILNNLEISPMRTHKLCRSCGENLEFGGCLATWYVSFMSPNERIKNSLDNFFFILRQ
jgi:hypothetical protein